MGGVTANRCSLCCGDGWITDALSELNRLNSEEESRRFKERMGLLTGAAEGRMACPRCQPDWKKPK